MIINTINFYICICSRQISKHNSWFMDHCTFINIIKTLHTYIFRSLNTWAPLWFHSLWIGTIPSISWYWRATAFEWKGLKNHGITFSITLCSIVIQHVLEFFIAHVLQRAILIHNIEHYFHCFVFQCCNITFCHASNTRYFFIPQYIIA